MPFKVWFNDVCRLPGFLSPVVVSKTLLKKTTNKNCTLKMFILLLVLPSVGTAENYKI